MHAARINHQSAKFISHPNVTTHTKAMCLKEALKKLGPMVSERRKARIASAVASRTNSLSLLLENVHNEGNECAILRSMDALGCLHLHKLQTVPAAPAAWHDSKKTKKLRFPPRTDAGARGWVHIHHWTHLGECISHLKGNHGYSLVSTCPSASLPISALDFDRKLLVAFGNESSGISEELAAMSDQKFSLPMLGFVDSYNISVCAALVLYHAYLHRTKSHVRNALFLAR